MEYAQKEQAVSFSLYFKHLVINKAYISKYRLILFLLIYNIYNTVI